MYDIIIIGAGPAGLTAAIYAKRAAKSVLLLEKNNYGGKIIYANDIENYPAEAHISGTDFATKIYNQAKDLGAEIIYEEAIEIKNYEVYKEVITSKNTYKAKAVIVATGSYNKKLNLNNESELVGSGVSYCATCDGAFYKDKVVAVVGGGNTALEDAIYLSNIAKKVYLIHRRDRFKADASLVNSLKEKNNIEIIYDSNITKLVFDDKLSAICVTNANDSKTINVDGLFVAIGSLPATNNFDGIIETDDKGYIVSDESCTTNVPGIFVCGDVRTKSVRQLVTATSDGAVAAINAANYIDKLF